MPPTAIRGPFLHLIDDPFYRPISDCLRYLPDGLMVVENGIIVEIGPYAELKNRYAQLPLTHYPNKIIVPGFIDTHVHFPQTEIIAAYGEQLLTWLDRYIFPTEQKFSDRAYALTVAEHFLDELLRHGTTTALVFTSVYPQSTDAFFEAAQARNLRMIAGKVLMDRHAPEALLDTPDTAYSDSRQLIEKWHQQDRLLYAVTPRFAITSTPEQLRAAGRLLQDFPDVYMHTHLSENTAEIAWTNELFPEAGSYLGVYDQAGLLGKRSVFAHGVHLSETELCRLSECECAIAHCPTSNLFLGSGLFPLHQAKNPDRPVKVALGTDVGAGTSFSLLRTGGEAYKVAQLQQQSLDPFQALFLATLGGAQALCLEDKIGSFIPGKEADFIVLDPQATPTLAFRNQPYLSVLNPALNSALNSELSEADADDRSHQGDIANERQMADLRSLIFSLFILGDERAIHATHIAGMLV
ncbi:MAG: guanine deaminase [Phormidesmis priestleyi]|uniref:Guanine deaminase n=1 Tax=Phormidesmis priestleyi TaxID=268141 RepID=A0A2W4YE83_9CYAN|nr:MAG: guanine deaminase [Phormidesmis priestleyi]